MGNENSFELNPKMGNVEFHGIDVVFRKVDPPPPRETFCLSVGVQLPKIRCVPYRVQTPRFLTKRIFPETFRSWSSRPRALRPEQLIDDEGGETLGRLQPVGPRRRPSPVKT